MKNLVLLIIGIALFGACAKGGSKSNVRTPSGEIVLGDSFEVAEKILQRYGMSRSVADQAIQFSESESSAASFILNSHTYVDIVFDKKNGLITAMKIVFLPEVRRTKLDPISRGIGFLGLHADGSFSVRILKIE